MKNIFFEKIPIKKQTASEAALFEQLVAMVQQAKKVEQAFRLPISESKRDACATFLEELIDACVLELYFPEEASTKDLQFMDQVADLLNVDQASRLIERKRDAYATLSDIGIFVTTPSATSSSASKPSAQTSSPSSNRRAGYDAKRRA